MDQIIVAREKVNTSDIDFPEFATDVHIVPTRFSLCLKTLIFPRPVPSGGLIFQIGFGDRSTSSVPLAFDNHQNGSSIELNAYKLNLETFVRSADHTLSHLSRKDPSLSFIDSFPISDTLRAPLRIAMLDAEVPDFVHDATVLDIAKYITSDSTRFPNESIPFLLGAILHVTVECCSFSDNDSCIKMSKEDLFKHGGSLPLSQRTPSLHTESIFHKERDPSEEPEHNIIPNDANTWFIPKSSFPCRENSELRNTMSHEEMNCMETKQEDMAPRTSSKSNAIGLYFTEPHEDNSDSILRQSSGLSEKREEPKFQTKQNLSTGTTIANRRSSETDDMAQACSRIPSNHNDGNGTSNCLRSNENESDLFCHQPCSFSKDLEKVPYSFLTGKTLSSDLDCSNNMTNNRKDESTDEMMMNLIDFSAATPLSSSENMNVFALREPTENSTDSDRVEKLSSEWFKSRGSNLPIPDDIINQRWEEQGENNIDHDSNTNVSLEATDSESFGSDGSRIYMDKDNMCKKKKRESDSSSINGESSSSMSSSDTDSISTDSESNNDLMFSRNGLAFLSSSDSSDNDFESIGATIARRMREGAVKETNSPTNPPTQLEIMNVGSSVTRKTHRMDSSLDMSEDPHNFNENGSMCAGRTLFKKRKSLSESKSRKQRELSRDKEEPPFPPLTNKRFCGEHVTKYDGGIFKEQAIEMDLPTPNVLTFWMIKGPNEEQTKPESRKIQIGKGNFAVKRDEEQIKMFYHISKTRRGPPARCGLISPLQKTVVRLRDPDAPPDFIDLGTPSVLHPSISQKLIGIMERNVGLTLSDEQNPTLRRNSYTDHVREETIQTEHEKTYTEDTEISEDEAEAGSHFGNLMKELGWQNSIAKDTVTMVEEKCEGSDGSFYDFPINHINQGYAENRSTSHNSGNNNERNRGINGSNRGKRQEKNRHDGKYNRDGRDKRITGKNKGSEGESGDESGRGNDNRGGIDSEEQQDDLSSLAKRRRYDSDVSSQTSNDDWREEEIRQSQGGLGRRCRRPSYDQVVNRSIQEVVEEFKPNRYVSGVTVPKHGYHAPSQSDIIEETKEERLFRRTVMCEGGVTQKGLEPGKVQIVDLELEMENMKEESSKTEQELLYVIERLRCEKYSLVDMVEERDNTLEEILQGNSPFVQRNGPTNSERERDRREIERQTAYIDQMARQLQCERARCSGVSAENERLLNVVRRLADEIQEATTFMDVRRVIVEANRAVEFEREERLRLEKVVHDLEETIRLTSSGMHKTTQNRRWWQ